MKNPWQPISNILITMITVIAFLVVPVVGLALTNPIHDFPRVAAWQLNTGKSSASELARFDTVILQTNAQNSRAKLFSDLRRLNPDTVILAYASPVEDFSGRINEVEPQGWGVIHDLVKGIQPEWRLRTWQGEQLSFWPGHTAMNLVTPDSRGITYAQYLGDFLYDNVLATGMWDGLLFDTVWDTISWFSEDIDINGDGRKDSKAVIDAQWHEGQRQLLQRLRDRAGSDYLILTNGDGKFSQLNNGRVFEGFPEFWEGGWTGSMARYFDTDKDGYLPRFNILNADTDNTGDFSDYRFMRYGLTSTLMGNGYFNFDYGTLDRSFVPYYDEYGVSLGRPTTAAFDLLGAKAVQISPGIWRRDFENGIGLVNSTDAIRTISLPGEFEKVHGRQDPLVNNGQVVSKVTLQPRDGLILLRPLQEVLGNVYQNGVFTRIFSADSRVIRSAFFSFDERFDGGQSVYKADINNDNRVETLVSDESSVIIYADNGAIIKQFFPYTRAYKGGINFGVGDLNGDGTLEIVTGTGRGGGPQVRIFSSEGRLINPGFFAYAQDFRGGVHVAVGDLDSDGISEIITGAGFGGGPHVRIFNRDGRLLNPGFFAYDPAFRGGVNVAVGDINGNGRKEIITGAGPTGGPHVRVFSSQGKMLTEFFGFTARSSAGVQVAAYDFDGDRRDEIITMTDDFFIFSQ